MSENTGFMAKLEAVMMKYIVPVGQKISQQRHLAAVRDGLTVMIPATIIGGFSCLIAVPPVPASITEATNPIYAFLLAWKSFAGANAGVLMIPYYLTISIISIYQLLILQLKITIIDFMPWESLLIKLLHEWVWIKFFYVMHTWSIPKSLHEHHGANHCRNACCV